VVFSDVPEKKDALVSGHYEPHSSSFGVQRHLDLRDESTIIVALSRYRRDIDAGRAKAQKSKPRVAKADKGKPNSGK